MELPGKSKIGGPKTRFMTVVREDMQLVSMADEDAEDRKKWNR